MDGQQHIRTLCAESYGRLKKLKLVGSELGMPWQTVYIHLRAAGVPVTGDKSRYGSDTDRLAAKAEQEFQRLVPGAENQNEKRFQAKIDFMIGVIKVDIKAATKRAGHRGGTYPRFSFSIKKQEMSADFIVCFGYIDDSRYRLFLLPGELVRHLQTITISADGRSKWHDYEIKQGELCCFFDDLSLEKKLSHGH